MPVVETAPWWRRHPVLTGTAAVLVVALVAAGVFVVVSWLSCGEGMERSQNDEACVGINLAGEKFSPDQPQELTDLVDQVAEYNDAITGDNYVTIVLLLNMTPVPNVDTASFADVTRSIQGAITAVWRANHTSAFGKGADPVPRVKLLLANTGSRNLDWEPAVDQINAAKEEHHITAVAGLSQSNKETRNAVTRLTTTYHLPVIGGSVTGDNMDNNVFDEKQLDGFYRIAPTNRGLVTAAAEYIKKLPEFNPNQGSFGDVAIVWDQSATDDYVKTLHEAALVHLPGAKDLPYRSSDPTVPITNRDSTILGQLAGVRDALCPAPPKVVFFAGRGADLAAFVQTWTDSGNCSTKPLFLITGDDGVKASTDTRVTTAVKKGTVKVRYTALASPDKWGSCGGVVPKPPVAHAAEILAEYRMFEAAFTGDTSCGVDPATLAPDTKPKPLDFPQGALATGQAMIAHDAVGLAIHAARRIGTAGVLQDRLGQLGTLSQVKCGLGAGSSANTMFGASGWIRYEDPVNEEHSPTGSIVPLIEIGPEGQLTTVQTGLPTTLPAPLKPGEAPPADPPC
ncbi:ABC transporter substrate-binding protein [Actinokineospora globicatena]|uniref:ABC transporter substrate-binding protein n=1 Tax=Actinokineospora globicatena TaxID=103729 RepID=UPI0020A35C9F|nr:hypothetical protein [Actinokineospora globicatena]MCP2303609.1 hypothetical protein [Actinokineospora globicatena]GLW79254.1 hypothetical protein Aglo01_37360 [Actinokineospora globicatena]GLW86336.1 hypothetical protein Aglo02_39750 [Actinokineospora globicatena]